MMRLKVPVALLAWVVACVTVGAQDTAALRRDVERRFDVLTLHDGIALRPKAGNRGVQSIELTEDTIAIDGEPATGAEVREKLGTDADLVLRLSYLTADERRALFGTRELARPVERPQSPDIAPPPDSTPTRTRRSSERVRFGGDVNIGEDEIVDGDVVVIGGSATVNGEITRDLVVVGGTADLGPHANVVHDVTVVGGGLRRAPGARIGGDLNEVGVGALDLRGLRMRGWTWPRTLWWGRAWGSFFALVSTLTRLAVLCLLVSLVILFGRGYVERVGARAAAEPLKAGVVGFLAQLLFIPVLVVTIVVLVVTIVGIPLLALIPFGLLALVALCLVGFSAVAYDVGRLVNARFGWPVDNAFRTAIAGIIVVISPVLIGRLVGLAGGPLFPITFLLLGIGFFVEYLAWTVGLGAVALSRFDRKPPAVDHASTNQPVPMSP